MVAPALLHFNIARQMTSTLPGTLQQSSEIGQFRGFIHAQVYSLQEELLAGFFPLLHDRLVHRASNVRGMSDLARHYSFFELVMSGDGQPTDCKLPGIFAFCGYCHAALAVLLSANCRGLSDLAGQYLFFELVISVD